MKMEGKFNGNSMGKLISLEIARETAHSRMPTSKKQFNNPKIPNGLIYWPTRIPLKRKQTNVKHRK
jgi:hypothetical protein